MLSRKLNDILSLIFAICGIVFLFLYPAGCIDAAKDGLTTALYIALPSIFPFMVLSKFIIAGNLHYPLSRILGKPFELIFGLDRKYATIFLLGCIGGYPLGAIAINDYLKNNEITLNDAEHMLGFCNNSGPMFITGTVGTLLLNNTMYGYVLYTIHIFSAIAGGIIMRVLFRPHINASSSNYRSKKAVSPLSSSVTGSASAMINIASYIIIFSVISNFITKIFGNSGTSLLASVLCVLEITTGIKFAAESTLPEIFKLSLISASLGFSGLCVFSQSRAIFEDIKISFKKYFLAKGIIAILSFIVAFVVFTIIFSY